MYLNFYNLLKEPFQITPDPAFLFMSPTHKEALASVIYAIEQRKGFVSIVGEVGTGKTTIIRSYLNGADRNVIRPIYIFNSNISFCELLETIFQELDLLCTSQEPYVMVQILYEALIDEYLAGHNIVLVIDEAQNMPVETLENLRMLSNLETATDKLLQIVLVGQPELEEKLNRHELRQLKQRLAVRCTIKPLTPGESEAYLNYRLSQAARFGDVIFSSGAIRRIVLGAKGFPRLLNIMSDNVLITGYGYQQKPISAKVAKEAISGFLEKKPRRTWIWGLAASLSLILLACALVFLPQVFLPKPGGRPAGGIEKKNSSAARVGKATAPGGASVAMPHLTFEQIAPLAKTDRPGPWRPLGGQLKQTMPANVAGGEVAGRQALAGRLEPVAFFESKGVVLP